MPLGGEERLDSNAHLCVCVAPSVVVSYCEKDDNRTHVLWLLNLHLGWACRDGSHRWSCCERVAWWGPGLHFQDVPRTQ